MTTKHATINVKPRVGAQRPLKGAEAEGMNDEDERTTDYDEDLGVTTNDK